MKWKRTGMTLVEILVVLGIIALMVSVLIPALSVVKNTAKEAKQKAQFNSINIALITFKNDYGDYPPSDCPPVVGDYTGAQKLAEALVGWDLLGFHPKSAWRSDGLDSNGGNTTYDPQRTRDIDGDGVPDTLKERKEPYLDIEVANAFKLGDVSGLNTGLFDNASVAASGLAPNTYVLCDVYNMKKVVLPDGSRVTAGAPILYYKANTSQKLITNIYQARDNDPLVMLKEAASGIEQPLGRANNNYEFFYNYIHNPKIESILQPYRPDSYILISAGPDGIYGTSDDVRNFGN